MRPVLQGPVLGLLLAVLQAAIALPPSAAPNDKTPIVFIPGFAGSTLVDSKGAVKWLDVAEGLGLKTPDLALPMRWENGIQPRDQLKPGEVLKGVQMVLGLFGEDIYGPWLKAVRKLNRPVYEFAYDWRRDPLEVNDEFLKFLERAREQSGSKLDVVGHSLGAMYVMAAVNQRPELFRQVILVGAPLSGDINAFADIQEGVQTGLNRRILSSDVIFTFPSAYVFLPERESRVADRDGNPEAIDFYSAKVWKSYGFGPFFSVKDPSRIRQMETFLEIALDHAWRFKLLLDPRAIPYPRIHVVSGNTTPTRVLAIRNGPASRRGLDFDSYPREKGDGETTVGDSLPEAGIPYDLHYSNKSHIHLMDTPIILKLLATPVD